MQRKNYIYLLSVISACAVVFLHTNSIFWTFSYESYWFWTNITECIFYFAVPIFFMISGITLLNYNERYLLQKSDYQYKICEAINKGIIKYLNS